MDRRHIRGRGHLMVRALRQKSFWPKYNSPARLCRQWTVSSLRLGLLETALARSRDSETVWLDTAGACLDLGI